MDGRLDEFIDELSLRDEADRLSMHSEMTIITRPGLETARLRLSAHETPRLEAEVLLGAVTAKSALRSWRILNIC
jgi:hypothetical protein